MTKSITLSILLLFLVSSTFSQSEIIKVIKLNKNNGGTYTIPCKVNGIPMTFIFDTGASDVSISLTEALFMLKNGNLTESDFTGIQKYRIANGEIQDGYTLLIRELEIEGLKLYNIKASISNSLKAPLLLGQSALSRLGIIQIDYKKNTLTILKRTDNVSNNYANTYNKTKKRSYNKSSYKIAKRKIRRTKTYKYAFHIGDGLYTNLGFTENINSNISLTSYNYNWTDTYGFFRKVGIKEKFTRKKGRDISRATLIGIFTDIGYDFDSNDILKNNGLIKTEIGAILWQWIRISGGIIDYNLFNKSNIYGYSGTIGLNIKLRNFQTFINYNQVSDKSFNVFNSYFNFGYNFNINLFRKLSKQEKENLKRYY